MKQPWWTKLANIIPQLMWFWPSPSSGITITPQCQIPVSSLPYSTPESVPSLLTCPEPNIMDLTFSAGRSEHNIISSTLPSTPQPAITSRVVARVYGWLVRSSCLKIVFVQLKIVFLQVRNVVFAGRGPRRQHGRRTTVRCRQRNHASYPPSSTSVTRAHPPRTPHLLFVFSLTFFFVHFRIWGDLP